MTAEADLNGAPGGRRHEEKPNKVLFLRNCPRSITEEDILALVQPFSPGYTPRIYVQAAKGQGFVEFEDTQHATRCLQYFQHNLVQLKGSTLHFSYSTRASVVTHEQLVQSLASTSRVLLVHVVNLMYPVSIEMLHTVFTRHGLVEKIVTFQKDQSVFQAMVQMSQPTEASSALQQLDSQNLFTGCNTLKIQYSTFGELTVKYNNAKTRDFLNTDLPAGPEAGAGPSGGAGPNSYGMQQGQQMSMMNGQMDGFAGYPPSGQGRDFGFGGGLEDMYGQMANQQMAQWGVQQQQQQDPRASQTVIICYHLTPDRLSVDQLFNIFSFYGLVSRVKIMQNKPDCCLIQYTESLFASLALQNLQGAQLYGQSLHLDFSKMREITIQPSSSDGRTKAFTANDQRYQHNVHSRVMRNACKPTPVLHIANISLDATERDLRAVFGPHGRIAAFRWVDRDPNLTSPPARMALVQMENVAEATLALVHSHNALLRDRQLKVSFSKNAVDSDVGLPE
jgi:polypyrimidine tract-binding protein 2